ncbi:hypothetical protein [Steroidobacter cummioxidans]|uniref:hypothetical protein n=1 Tax=Steroidobacter cummioxidans TaxID=1803913 RepID=UPI00129076CF|nr:hypothetical protein [Steroidobacter cummioxidans]
MADVRTQNTMSYSINIARERFSLWAACRAAQAGSAKAKRSELIAALEACGVIEFLRDAENHSISIERYDREYEKWVIGVQSHLEQVVKKPVMFGVAAKLVSTYLKSVFLLGGFHDTPLSHHLTPPVDSILLKGLDDAHGTNLTSTYKWQKLTRQDYLELLVTLRKFGGSGPVWHLEQYWKP